MCFSCTPLKPAFVLTVLNNWVSSANCPSFSRLTSEHAAWHRIQAGFHLQPLSIERANCFSLLFSTTFAHMGDHSLLITWLLIFTEALKGSTSPTSGSPYHLDLLCSHAHWLLQKALWHNIKALLILPQTVLPTLFTSVEVPAGHSSHYLGHTDKSNTDLSTAAMSSCSSFIKKGLWHRPL